MGALGWAWPLKVLGVNEHSETPMVGLVADELWRKLSRVWSGSRWVFEPLLEGCGGGGLTPIQIALGRLGRW
jgi:hypothetical protein